MRVDSQGGDDDEGGGSSSRRSKVFTGIGVEVKFAAGANITKMKELSGGQKVQIRVAFCRRSSLLALIIVAHGDSLCFQRSGEISSHC